MNLRFVLMLPLIVMLAACQTTKSGSRCPVSGKCPMKDHAKCETKMKSGGGSCCANHR
jgi:hypothetical protein